MRINSISQNDAISKYLNNVNVKQAQSPKNSGISDSVELSEGAQKYASLLKAAKQAIENSEKAEETKAADIAARVSKGAYKVSTDELVRSIMSGIPERI